MKLIHLSLCLLALCLTTGCMTGLKMGYKTIKGAEADIYPIQPIPETEIRHYGKFDVGSVTTDVGPICPPMVQDEVRRAMMEKAPMVLDKEGFSGPGKTLRAEIVCRFFKAKKLLGTPRLDLLVTLKDAESGQELGQVYVEGVSESPVEGKPTHLAEANAEELAKYLAELKIGQKEE